MVWHYSKPYVHNHTPPHDFHVWGCSYYRFDWGEHGDVRIVSLFFADDVVLLVSLTCPWSLFYTPAFVWAVVCENGWNRSLNDIQHEPLLLHGERSKLWLVRHLNSPCEVFQGTSNWSDTLGQTQTKREGPGNIPGTHGELKDRTGGSCHFEPVWISGGKRADDPFSFCLLQTVWAPKLSSTAGWICCWRNSKNFLLEPRRTLSAGTLI